MTTERHPQRQREIQERRRLVRRVGLLVLVLAVFILSVVGCIFDEGTYQGGGRRTEAPTSEEPQPVVPTSTATTSPPVDSSSGSPPPQDTGVE